MRLRTAALVLAAVSVAFTAITAPGVLVLVVFGLGAYWLLRARRHGRGLFR